MLVDCVTHQNPQIQTISALDQLIGQNGLPGHLEAFLLSCRVDQLSPATLRYYRQKVGAFVSHSSALGARAPSEITASHIRLFLLKLQETNNSTSVHDYYRAVKRFFNWLIAEEMLEHSPMASIRPPRMAHKIVKPFNLNHIQGLLLLCDQRKFVGPRNRAIILMFLDTGLRLRELGAIQIGDIDMDRETIRIMGKGARERIVRIGKYTQKALLRYLVMRNDNYPCLWVSEERRALTTNAIQLMIRKLGKLAGFTDVRCSPHTFRHSFATQWLRNGGGEFGLQSALGHSTLTMTRRYVETVRSEDAVVQHRRVSPVDNMKLN